MARHRKERAAFAEKNAARSKQIFEEENKYFQDKLIQLDRLQPEKQRTSEPAQAR